MRLLNKLVEIPSLSGQEGQIQKYIFDWLSGHGLNPIWQGQNVILHLPGQNHSKAMILNAHVDTVSTGNLSDWQTDPYQLTTKNQQLFGLGISDDKVSVAVMLELATKVKSFNCDLWLAFVVEEETNGQGTSEFVDWFIKNTNYQKVAAVLMEPTALNEIQIGSKGNVFIKLTVNGQSGHGSRPDQIKVNSVLTMSEVLIALTKLEKSWQKKYPDEVLDIPTIGIGTSIVGGDLAVPNKFANSCTATLDIRTTPKLHKKVLIELKKYLKSYPVEVDYLYPPISFGLTDKSDPLVKAAQKIFKAKITAAPWSTDQPFFTEVNIPSIIIGPGEPSCIHQPNEWCSEEKFKEALKLYPELISKWVNLGVE